MSPEKRRIPALYRWPDCPAPVVAQVEGLIAAIRALLTEDLVGVYLHGSLAMGSPNPEPKDIDLLVVTRRGLTPAERRRLGELLLAQSGAPRPVEIHFLRPTTCITARAGAGALRQAWRAMSPLSGMTGSGATRTWRRI